MTDAPDLPPGRRAALLICWQSDGSLQLVHGVWTGKDGHFAASSCVHDLVRDGLLCFTDDRAPGDIKHRHVSLTPAGTAAAFELIKKQTTGLESALAAAIKHGTT